jgi:hypothetical protein
MFKFTCMDPIIIFVKMLIIVYKINWSKSLFYAAIHSLDEWKMLTVLLSQSKYRICDVL